jgi:hypothetical protein
MHCTYNRWHSKYLLLTPYNSFFSSIRLWHISWSSGERCRFESSQSPVRITILTLFVSGSSFCICGTDFTPTSSRQLVHLFVSESSRPDKHSLPRRWKCHFYKLILYSFVARLDRPKQVGEFWRMITINTY